METPYAIHNDVKFKALELIDVARLRLGVLQGEFHWHKHDREDEGRTVELAPQQGFTVPKGVVHRTRAPQRTVVLMIESRGVVPTGD